MEKAEIIQWIERRIDSLMQVRGAADDYEYQRAQGGMEALGDLLDDITEEE